MNITQALLDKAKAGFKSLYNAGAEKIVSHHERLAMVVTSTSPNETYGWLKDTGTFREWIGDRIIQNLSEAGFVIINKPFESTVGVSRENIEDDKIGLYSARFKQMGADAKRHPDTLLFPLILAGFTSVCFDGQYFYDTDHPVLDAKGIVQSVSNSGGGAGAPWFLFDTTQPIKALIFQKRKEYEFVSMDNPTDQNVFMRKEFVYGVDTRCNVGYGLWQMTYGSKQPLDAANFEVAEAAMISRTGDGGKPLHIAADVIVCGSSNKSAAERLFNSKTLANGQDNIHFGKVEIIVSPYLP